MEIIDGYTMFDRTWVELVLIGLLMLGIFTFVQICIIAFDKTITFFAKIFAKRKNKRDEEIGVALNRIANVLEHMEKR